MSFFLARKACINFAMVKFKYVRHRIRKVIKTMRKYTKDKLAGYEKLKIAGEGECSRGIRKRSQNPSTKNRSSLIP